VIGDDIQGRTATECEDVDRSDDGREGSRSLGGGDRLVDGVEVACGGYWVFGFGVERGSERAGERLRCAGGGNDGGGTAAGEGEARGGEEGEGA
jgi:hypothetical protein